MFCNNSWLLFCFIIIIYTTVLAQIPLCLQNKIMQLSKMPLYLPPNASVLPHKYHCIYPNNTVLTPKATVYSPKFQCICPKYNCIGPNTTVFYQNTTVLISNTIVFAQNMTVFTLNTTVFPPKYHFLCPKNSFSQNATVISQKKTTRFAPICCCIYLNTTFFAKIPLHLLQVQL